MQGPLKPCARVLPKVSFTEGMTPSPGLFLVYQGCGRYMLQAVRIKLFPGAYLAGEGQWNIFFLGAKSELQNEGTPVP